MLNLPGYMNAEWDILWRVGGCFEKTLKNASRLKLLANDSKRLVMECRTCFHHLDILAEFVSDE